MAEVDVSEQTTLEGKTEAKKQTTTQQPTNFEFALFNSIYANCQAQIDDLKQKLEAKDKRIQFLEKILEQRDVETKNDFKAMQPFFESVKAKILLIFHELPVGMGLTHQEIQDAFAKRFPMISVTNVPRRVRELVKEERLWSSPDPDGTVRFYLKLKESES